MQHLEIIPTSRLYHPIYNLLSYNHWSQLPGNYTHCCGAQVHNTIYTIHHRDHSFLFQLLVHYATHQTLIWPPLCIGYMVINLSFLWLSTMEVICSFVDRIQGICLLSQNRVGSIYWISLIFLCFLVTLISERFILYCLGVFSSSIYFYSANRLHFIMPFTRRINPLLVSTRFAIAITFFKSQACILEYWLSYKPAPL